LSSFNLFKLVNFEKKKKPKTINGNGIVKPRLASSACAEMVT